MDLTSEDYKMILKHYKVKIPKTKKERREAVDKLLATKMCKCIKTVEKTSKIEEPGAIAICNKSIFRNRGLKFNRITCKKRYKFVGNKKTKRNLVKTKKLKYKKKNEEREK